MNHTRRGLFERRKVGWIAFVGAAVVLLAGCAPAAPDEAEGRGPVGNTEGMAYSTSGGEKLLMDACLAPETTGGTPAVLLIHGGGFKDGGRTSSGMPQLCEKLADAGYSAFPIDYRLLPESSFPSQVEDAQAAVAWLREPGQVKRFGIDPERIGVVGSSAGAIIAQNLGASGTGSLTSGSRVAAVVSLSGASDFTDAGLSLGTPGDDVKKLVLAYLGCSSFTDCDSAREASPRYAVDKGDPPMLLINSTQEIVPVEQAEAMKTTLDSVGVEAELIETPGSKHGVSVLTSGNLLAVKRFLLAHL